jgi:hypothetical protein
LGRRAEIGHNRKRWKEFVFVELQQRPMLVFTSCPHYMIIKLFFFEVLSSLFRVAGMRTWIQEAGAKRRKG